jgi:phosphohistidine phosphatase
MDLFLIRHTKAHDGNAYGSDSHRPLTADGRRAARAVGEALRKKDVRFDAIVTSPLVRAVETAELVALETKYDGALAVSDSLEPGGSVQEIVERLIVPAADHGGDTLALVGHEPSMGNLLSALLGKPGLSLSKGAAVRLDWNGKRAKLVWSVKPKRLDPDHSLGGI